MTGKGQRMGRFGAGLGLALGGAVALTAFAAPVFAQGRSMFDFFQPFSRDYRDRDYYAPVERQADFSRAPAPRKVDPPPPNTVLVLGDSMADWLAYGLE